MAFGKSWTLKYKFNSLVFMWHTSPFSALYIFRKSWREKSDLRSSRDTFEEYLAGWLPKSFTSQMSKHVAHCNHIFYWIIQKYTVYSAKTHLTLTSSNCGSIQCQIWYYVERGIKLWLPWLDIYSGALSRHWQKFLAKNSQAGIFLGWTLPLTFLWQNLQILLISAFHGPLAE